VSHPIPMVDLAVQGAELEELRNVIGEVLERGWFILGPEVAAFEAELANAIGRTHAVGVASGTDALSLGLRSMGIGPGDEVIVPDMTAFPTAAAVVDAGATPVLVDIEPERPLLDLGATLAALSPNTRAVILVHLYGVPADAAAFARALEPHGVALIEDCAQAQGGTLPSGEPVGGVGAFAAFSFYPTKNLAALGDGGAVATDSEQIAGEARAWRSHGERARRYEHELPARNSRLDDMQAAVLRVRLRGLADAVERRRGLSKRYESGLPATVRYVAHGPGGAPHLAVVAVENRDELAAHLRSREIGTGVHYPLALSAQPGLDGLARHAGGDRAARWAASCLSLPLHHRLPEEDVEEVISTVSDWIQ
jgi:dTDP-3-amino-3,4,6-trideoxy-alpha-D-glucose transaminase